MNERTCSFTPTPGLPYASAMPNSPSSAVIFTSVYVRASLEHHHLHVANLDALALRRGELVELEKKRKSGRVAEELAATETGAIGRLLC